MNCKYFVIFAIIFVIQLSDALPISKDQQAVDIRLSTGNDNESDRVEVGVATEAENVRNARQFGFGGSNAFASANAGSFGGGFPGGIGFSGASASAQAGAGGFGGYPGFGK